MRIFADYHTHTVYSHGKGTIEENVVVAIKKGLEAIGITDHGPANIGIGMDLKDFDKMKKEIDFLRRKYDNIEIKLGVEANVIGVDGQLDVPLKILKSLDIVLVGLHPFVKPASFRDGIDLFFKNQLAKHLELFNKSSRTTNTRALVNAIKRNPIDVITHPGLKLSIDTRELAKAAAEYNVALEINSGHRHLTEDYIRIALEEGANFLISSDAHSPEDVGDVEWGKKLVEKMGIPVCRIINART